MLDLRGALVVLVLAGLAVALAAFVLWRARPHPVDLGAAIPAPAGVAEVVAPRPGPAEPGGSPPAAPGPNPRPELTIDVEGKVAHPGVVTVPAGSRVRDALSAAGGALPGVATTTLNLAEPVSDGEQVVLGVPGAPGGSASSSTSGVGRLLDLNTASASDLHTLPGVGPVLAGRIVEFRRMHGRFTSVDELREIPGIGRAKFAAIRPRVRV
jgi:competence protein ComEA